MDIPIVDLSSAVPMSNVITFKGNNSETVTLYIDEYVNVAHLIGWDKKIQLIKILRMARLNDNVISLKLAKDIVEWVEKHYGK